MKTILLADILSVLEAFAPLKYQESFDNCGLLIGDPAKEITGVLLCVDVTMQQIEDAKKAGANLIISHHPLIFKGIKRITQATESERIITAAIRNDISIYAGHTNFDSVAGGVSFKLGQKLGLLSMRTLSVSPHGEQVGLGVIGQLQEQCDTIKFLQQVKATLGCKVVRYSEIRKQKVKKVALCGGAGGEFIPLAIAEGADVYLSADLRYHEFFTEYDQITVADFGHFETEQYIIEIFYEVISKNFPNFAVHYALAGSNPINYLL